MPSSGGTLTCQAVVPSAPAELAWVLHLLLGTATYSEPALNELDATLLPGITSHRAQFRPEFARIWGDGAEGCPELIPAAAAVGALLEPGMENFFAGLDGADSKTIQKMSPLSEAPPQRLLIEARLRRLGTDRATRRRYVRQLAEVWDLLDAPWQSAGLALVQAACQEWERRIAIGAPIEELVPPRHPLARATDPELVDVLATRIAYVLSPIYFCTSGGHVVDVGQYVHIGVPASALLPSRRALDAAFVANRLRVLAEPTRVKLLIQLLAGPAGIMQIVRAQGLPQATVSGHVKALTEAGLLVTRRRGARITYEASLRRIERLLEDARATLARWA